jgi:hypothetical protein
MTDAQYNQQQTDQYFNGPNPLSDGSGAGTDPTAPPTSSDPGAPPPPSNFSASTPWGNVGSGGSSGSSGSSTQIPGLQQLLSTLGLGSNTNLSTVGGLAGLAALIGKATGATKTSSTAFNPPPLWGSLGQSGSGPSANNTFGAPNKTFQQSPNVDYAHYGESGHTPSQAFFQPAGGASDNGMVAGTQQAGVPVNTGSGAPNGVVGNGSLPPGLLQTLQALNSQGNTPGGQQPSMYGQPPVMLPASGISSAQVQHADGGYIDDDNHYAMGGIAGSADGQPDQSSTTQLNGQLTNGNVNGTHSQPVGGLLSGLQMLQEQMQGNHQTMSPAQPLFGPQQAPMSMEQSGSDFHYHAPNVGGQPSSGLLGMLQSLGGMGGMSQAGVSGGNVAGPLSGLQQASGGMPLAGVMGGGQSPSAAMQQVQSSPYTASPNPAPSPPPLAVQSTANSAPSAQAQPSTPGVTTPAMQQTNPQPNAPAIQQPSSGLSGMLQPGVMGGGASMPMAGSPGIVAQSMRQSYSTPSARMGIQQHGNGDGTQPWHNQMGGWNRERGGPRFADGGLNPADSNVHGEPHPGILDALRQIFLPPPRPTGPPPGRAHGGMAPQVHEQGALGAMAPDMTSHPDHGSNSRHNYTGNMTQSSGRADDINAKLANNEYIMDAETTALAGDGNPDEGARRFDQLREEIRKHKGKALAKGKISPNAKPRLSSYNPAVVS